VGPSKVIHLQSQSGELSIFLEETPARVRRFYYLYRNQLYIRKRFIGRHAFLIGIARSALEVSRLLRSGRWKKASIALRGTLAGLTFNPESTTSLQGG
jgi:dTDP-4-dehydrorhamnose reductase